MKISNVCALALSLTLIGCGEPTPTKIEVKEITSIKSEKQPLWYTNGVKKTEMLAIGQGVKDYIYQENENGQYDKYESNPEYDAKLVALQALYDKVRTVTETSITNIFNFYNIKVEGTLKNNIYKLSTQVAGKISPVLVDSYKTNTLETYLYTFNTYEIKEQYITVLTNYIKGDSLVYHSVPIDFENDILSSSLVLLGE
jgi:hypothetical protein